MKRPLVLFLLLFAAFCASRGPSTMSIPGHGAISVEIVPNPIVAKSLGGGRMYEFPLEVVVRETGGHPVSVTQVSADVYALGGIHVGAESWGAAKIAALGYPTTLPPKGELRYSFRPRKEVPNERLFSGVTAEVRIEATDDTGTTTAARTTVGVRR